MKSVTSYTLLNNIPIISISHKGLEAIKEIVRIAPQEAQWFHTVEPIIYKQSPNEIHLHLSEKVYIPSQNTSAVQVDTTASMMMDFYHELKKDYEDQQVVNSKLSAMTCWCHSHHNMSPNPSSQDDLQFNSFITLAGDQGVKAWQIMLIFNKKDQFYSRVYDPETGSIHEGIPIHVVHDYDFSYIHAAAKNKFIKPLPLFKRNFSPTSKLIGINSPYKEIEVPYFQQDQNNFDLNFELAEQVIENLYRPFKKKLSNKTKVKINHNDYISFYTQFKHSFSIKEYLWLYYVLIGDHSSLLSSYPGDVLDSATTISDCLSHKEINHIEDYFKNYFLTTTQTLDSLIDNLALTFYFDDAPSKSALKQMIKEAPV